MSLEVLLEDNHCLAVNKPAGVPSQGDETGSASLVDMARSYLRIKYAKPGEVYLGLLHRLDRPTSGVVLLARTSKAAGRLSEQFRSGTVQKVYWAIVEGAPAEPEGEWVDHLEKDESRNVTRVVASHSPEGKHARSRFRVLERRGGLTKIELQPGTGRGHQLRVQLASRGMPILGDVKYGSLGRLRAGDGGSRIALHARGLGFNHPTKREWTWVEAPPPADWPGLDR